MREMAWMIVTREFNWSRPRSIYSFKVRPSPDPQQRPRDLVNAAVKAGAAREVPAPRKAEAKAAARKRSKAT